MYYLPTYYQHTDFQRAKRETDANIAQDVPEKFHQHLEKREGY